MKFVLEENIPFSVMDFLLSKKYEVVHIRQSELRGASDKKISEYAKKEKAILITRDVEMASSLLYPPGAHYSLIVLRLPYYFNHKQIVKFFGEFLDNFDVRDLIGKVIILELDKYRLRKI